jgi:hypothetical protein
MRGRAFQRLLTSRFGLKCLRDDLASLLALCGLVFLLLEKVLDGFDTTEASDGGCAFGEDACVGIELFSCLDGCECSCCFF